MIARNAQPDDGPLLVDSHAAAELLSISERTLWTLSAPRGDLPVVRLGRAVRYDLDDLREFIGRQKQGADNGKASKGGHEE